MPSVEPAAGPAPAWAPPLKLLERSGVTPDRSKTFSGGAHPGAGRAEGSTAGMPLRSAHLQSVVGLVWRSVVLWMLLLALLTLANIVG